MTTDQKKPSVGSYKWVFADSPGDWGLPGVAQVFEEGADQLSDAPVCSFEYETPYCIGSSAKTRALAAEARKKARLIAAAPDLLAALEKLAPHIPDAVTACHGNKCRQPFCEDCRGGDEAQKAIEAAMEAHLQTIAAIAKARGA